MSTEENVPSEIQKHQASQIHQDIAALEDASIKATTADVEGLDNNLSENVTQELPPIPELVQSRWERIRSMKLTDKQSDVLSWGAMAVIGAAYPFMGGINEHAIEASKTIIGYEGLFAYVGLGVVAGKKYLRLARNSR